MFLLKKKVTSAPAFRPITVSETSEVKPGDMVSNGLDPVPWTI